MKKSSSSEYASLRSLIQFAWKIARLVGIVAAILAISVCAFAQSQSKPVQSKQPQSKPSELKPWELEPNDFRGVPFGASQRQALEKLRLSCMSASELAPKPPRSPEDRRAAELKMEGEISEREIAITKHSWTINSLRMQPYKTDAEINKLAAAEIEVEQLRFQNEEARLKANTAAQVDKVDEQIEATKAKIRAQSGDGMDVCDDSSLIGPVKVSSTFGFSNDRLVQVWIAFASDQFATLRDIFIERYGLPTNKRIDHVRTKAGVPYESEVLTWTGERVDIRLHQFVDTVEESAALIVDRVWSEASAKAREDEKKKAAKTF